MNSDIINSDTRKGKIKSEMVDTGDCINLWSNEVY